MSDGLQRIDQALAAGDVLQAISFLQLYFHSNPTLVTAREVLDRLEPRQLPATKRPFRAFFLRSFTVEPMFPLLRASALLHGVDLSVAVGQFNAYPQEILDPHSPLFESKPDIIFMAVTARDFLPDLWFRAAELSASDLSRLTGDASRTLRSWVQTIRERSSAHLVLFDFDLPLHPSAGLLDAQNPNGQVAQIHWLNQELRTIASTQPGVSVLPLSILVARIGRERFYDERRWLTVRMPWAASSLWPMAQECVRTILPAAGKTAKALVVDLDNTLWGGVIGEDGLEGIKLGPEYPGAAYQRLQRVILDLHERGIILAIASKNNPADALEAIEEHPGMILRRHHFSSVQISWNEKAQSLNAIASELNIGIDSLVFLDDNPVEREHVRVQTPEVYVIELSGDAMTFADALRQVPVFERTRLTDDDRRRGRQYMEERERTALRKTAGSVEEFLHSLEMVATIDTISPPAAPRVAQLTQKTNQFNVTSRRYDEQQILSLISSPAAKVYACTIRDRFGDSGVVGVVIAHTRERIWEIDTLLLSCRVIGRTVETAMLSHVVAEARMSGARAVQGWFLPTKKNAPATEFYPAHGFEAIAQESTGVLWQLDLTAHEVAFPPWIKMSLQASV